MRYVKLKCKNFGKNVFFDLYEISTVDRDYRALSTHVSFIRRTSLQVKILTCKIEIFLHWQLGLTKLAGASSPDSDSRSKCTATNEQCFNKFDNNIFNRDETNNNKINW